MLQRMYNHSASKVEQSEQWYCPYAWYESTRESGCITVLIVNFKTTRKWTEFIVCKRSAINANISTTQLLSASTMQMPN
jgi:hypothetical protein